MDRKIKKYESQIKVKLVSYTKSKIRGIKKLDELIAYVARVSNPENQNNNLTANKLIAYLIEHKHWSPLDMVDITIEVETTRDIGRQMLRHYSFRFQEFSQRYAKATKFVMRELRLQDSKNRQNSLDCSDPELSKWWENKQTEVINLIASTYDEALSKGIAKEQARVILPEGLVMSKLYMKGSLRSWLHYLAVRCDKATQKEHRLIAEKIGSIIEELRGSNG